MVAFRAGPCPALVSLNVVGRIYIPPQGGVIPFERESRRQALKKQAIDMFGYKPGWQDEAGMQA